MTSSHEMKSSFSMDRRTFLAAGAATLAAGCSGMKGLGGSMGSVALETKPFGEVGGKKVDLFTLTHENGTVLKFTNYGAIVTSILTKDKSGKLGDITLGFDDVQGYVAGSPYFGAIAGRCANRIAEGTFDLDGKSYRLATNNGPNHLHGGKVGFDKQVWTAVPMPTDSMGGRGVALTLVSPDGDEGYPGTLTAVVEYILTAKGEFAVNMRATTSAPTLCNLAHHTYWNLGGHDSGDVLGHRVTLPCSNYTPANGTLIPTGEIVSVAGTPFDFLRGKPIGQDIAKLKAEKDAGHGGGYDLNFCVDGADGKMRICARVSDPRSGRTLEVESDQPGLQFYSGNFLDGTLKGKGGAVYQQHQGFCLESQKYPDAIHHKNFPSVVLRPGEEYRHHMIHRFGV